jgi:hypothetical protein
MVWWHRIHVIVLTSVWNIPISTTRVCTEMEATVSRSRILVVTLWRFPHVSFNIRMGFDGTGTDRYTFCSSVYNGNATGWFNLRKYIHVHLQARLTFTLMLLLLILCFRCPMVGLLNNELKGFDRKWSTPGQSTTQEFAWREKANSRSFSLWLAGARAEFRIAIYQSCRIRKNVWLPARWPEFRSWQ